MGKGNVKTPIPQTTPRLTKGDIALIEARQETAATAGKKPFGPNSSLGWGGYDYKAMGYGKAASGYKSWSWNPIGTERGKWDPMAMPENMALKASEQQTIPEMVADVVVGGSKRFNAGFIDSIGAWDISNMTAMAMDKTNVDYSNAFNRIAKKLTDSANEENHIYQDPNGSIWNLPYLANQVQQLGYTGGIVAEMLVEQLAATALTGGAGNSASLAKGAALFAKRAGQFGMGMTQAIKEAHMNAFETQNNAYAEFKKLGFSDEEAMTKSRQAANLHFKTEASTIAIVNGLQNMVLMGALNKSLSNTAKAFRQDTGLKMGLSDGIQDVGERIVGGMTKNKAIQGAAGWGLTAGSEAIEEGVQTGIGTYSQRAVQGKDTSWADLWEGNEMRDSMIGGALGGVLLGAGFKAVSKIQNRAFNKEYAEGFKDLVNFSANIVEKQTQAKAAYQEAIKTYEASPTTENKKKVEDLKVQSQQASHNAVLSGVVGSLKMDYAKGDGNTHMFDMNVEIMKQDLEAVKNADIEYLKVKGLVDPETGKMDEAKVKAIRETYQENIDDAYKIKDWFEQALTENTRDFKLASGIVQSKLNRDYLQRSKKEIDTALQDTLSKDPIFQELSETSKRRYLLENERVGIKSFVDNQNNDLVKQRLEEINEQLENTPEFTVQEKALLGEEFARDSSYAMAYGSGMNTTLAIFDSTKEIAERSSKEGLKKAQEEAAKKQIDSAKTPEELKAATEAAKDVTGVIPEKVAKKVAKKAADIKAKDSVEKVTGKKINNVPKTQQKEVTPTENKETTVSLFSAGMGNFTSGGEIDSTVADLEFNSREQFERGEYDQKIKDQSQSALDEITEELGREPNFAEYIQNYIDSFGRERIKKLLPAFQRGFELLGKEAMDVNHLFNSRSTFVSHLEQEVFNDSDSVEQVNQTIGQDPQDARIPGIHSVERGTATGRNKIAIFNPYNRETGKYTQAEFLEGEPADNTLRYFLQKGEKLMMALHPEYESVHVAVIDRTNPSDPFRSHGMPFGEFMEWITTDAATEYGYTKLEKNSEAWQNMWEAKIPMVYYKMGDNNLPTTDMVAYVQDVEWWHRNNVSQDSEQSPMDIAREGAEATHSERKRFFREGKNLATITEVSALGKEFFLRTKNEEGVWESNVDTGEEFITLEEATGETRLGYISASNEITLEDGTKIKIGEKHPGTNQDILLVTEEFVSAQHKNAEGAAVEVRKIKDINGLPVYKPYFPTKNNAVKKELLDSKVYNVAKYLLLNKIFATTPNQEVKKMLTDQYGIDPTSVQNFNIALNKADFASIDSNFSNLLGNFILLKDRIDTNVNHYTQISVAPDFISIFNDNKLVKFDFKTGNPATLGNFLEALLGSKDDGALSTTTVNLSKTALGKSGQMFQVSDSGEISDFKSVHGQNTYAGFLKTVYKTSVKSFPSKELREDGRPKEWITDIQPMVYLTNDIAETIIPTEHQPEVETVEVEDSQIDVNDTENTSTPTDVVDVNFLKEHEQVLRETLGDAEYERRLNSTINSYDNNARDFFTDEQASGLGIFRIPGVTNRQLSHIGDFLFNSVLATVRIKENKTISPRLIYERLMSSPEQFLLGTVKEKREKAASLRDPKFGGMFEALANTMEEETQVLQQVVDNKDTLLERLKLQLDELLGSELKYDRIQEGVINEDGDYINEIFDEDFEFKNQIETDYSKMGIEKDIKLTYSTSLKITFAGIEAVNTFGEKVSGELALPVYFKMGEVSDSIKALVVGTPSNTNTMLEKLKITADTNNSNKQAQVVASEMYNRLVDAPTHVKNEMLYKLAQQKLNMEMVIYSKNKSGRYTLKVQNTNSNSDLYRVREQWRNNFQEGPLVMVDSQNERFLNLEALKALHEDLKTFTSTVNQKNAEGKRAEIEKEGFELLERLGIKIGSNTYDAYVGEKGLSLFTSNKGFYNLVLKSLDGLVKRNQSELSLEKEDSMFLERVVNSNLNEIADKEILLNQLLATPSQRIAGKSFPGTAMRIMLDDVSEDLLNTKSSYFNFLKRTAYTKNNYMLKLIENSDFVKDMRNPYTRVSPEAIKEQGRSSFGDASIDKLPDTDNNLTQLAFFWNSVKEKLDTSRANLGVPNIDFRIAKMFPAALSDKGQMVAISTAVADLQMHNFQIDGNEVALKGDVIDFLLQNVFDNEMERIIHSYSTPTNITKYEQANKYFIKIHEFNNIAIGETTLEVALKVHFQAQYDSEQDKQEALQKIVEEARVQAAVVLSNVINADLSNKISVSPEGDLAGTWVTSDFISKEEGEYVLKYIDGKYLDSKFDKVEVSNLVKAKIAALDFITNQYLFQSNLYQLYIGDPALYAPGEKGYINQDGSIDSYKLAKGTMEAINKRIASLIAPGSVLAESTSDLGLANKYTQVFVNDVEAPSSIIREYIKMVTGQSELTAEQEQHLTDYLKKQDKEALKKLVKTNDNISTILGYFNIEGTDAQEYTTWQEHLDVLLGQGRITLEDKERLQEKIENDSFLENDPDLKVIFNPLKPVYAGMVQDEKHGVNRFVYIKSSSFPLLPSLTKGLKLDKVRIALEKLQEKGQNVRMSYQTANKVGSVNTTLNMSDFYDLNVDSVEELENFVNTKLIPNTLNLNRPSFKIQQDTPYKAKKYMEKGKDTQTTMGSQISKNILGAGINKMGNVFRNIFPQSVLEELGIDGLNLLSGANLDAIKTHVETEYMKLQETKLEKELGLKAGEKYFNLPDEKKKEVFKNLVDILRSEIKTRQYDKALLKELEIDETGLQTVVPIWLTNNADKFESLFLSVVKNRFIALKLPGNGHIVGSSEGFERVSGFNSLSKNVKSQITWLNPNHSGDLKATFIKNAQGQEVVSESEVLVQSHYNKTIIDPITGKKSLEPINLLSDEYSYTLEDGSRALRLEKLDDELMSNFSFRIPTSALQSGAILKVVGFLPHSMGDMLVVPDEHTKQIGEDFDIDKRYVYKSNYFVDDAGNIKKLTLDNFDEYSKIFGEQTDAEDFRQKALENAIIDVYKSVYTSTSKEVQQKIFRILSMEVAEDAVALIDTATSNIDKKNFTFLSDDVQRTLLKSGTSGKLGTAMHSNAVTYQAQLERLSEKRRLVVSEKDENGELHPVSIRIGNFVSDGVLGKINTLDGRREINAVHAENQNSAVDNVKAQIMAKRNENSYTMPVLIQMTLRGFDQDNFLAVELQDGTLQVFENVSDQKAFIASNKDNVKKVYTETQLSSLFLAQPILVKYVKMMEESQSLTSEFSSSREEVVLDALRKEYGVDPNQFNDIKEDLDRQMTATNLYNNLVQEDKFLQYAVLEKFLALRAESEAVQDIQRLMSLSSGGLGKSYFDVLNRIDALNALPSSSVKNATYLIGNYIPEESYLENPESYPGYVLIGNYAWKPTTSEGAMLIYSLRNATQIMEVNYPYNRNFINRTLNNVIAEKGNPLTKNNSTEFKWKVLKGLKDALQSNSDLQYFIGDIQEERNRLFKTERVSGFKSNDYQVKIIENTPVSLINPKTKQYESNVIGNLMVISNSKGERIEAIPFTKDTKIFKKNSNGDTFYRKPGSKFRIKQLTDGRLEYQEYITKTTKESLGQYISRIRQERIPGGLLKYPLFGNNGLLKSLSLHSDPTIQNNIDILKHVNINDLDLGVISKNEYFLQMLDDNTTSLGEWNGEKMTPRKLAQDLASYAFLANQENGAIGFRQFIDMDYLKAIGFDSNLRNILLAYENNAMMIETFVKQYYQHNPEQAKILSADTISIGDFKDLDDKVNKFRNASGKESFRLQNILKNVTSFSLHEEYPKYISIRDTEVKHSDSKYRLFEKTEDGMYQEIPVLGTFGFNEYNLKNYNQPTQLTDREFPHIVPGIKRDNFTPEEASQSPELQLETYYSLDSLEALVESLQYQLNPEGVEVLESIKPFLDNSVNIKVIDFATIGKTNAGFYRPNENTIYVNSMIIPTAVAKGYSLDTVLTKVSEMFVEEILHSVQVKALLEYGTVSITKENGYKEKVFTPNPDAPFEVLKLVALYEEAKEMLPYNPQTGDNYESMDIFEFMAGVFEHREEYVRNLDKIKDVDGRSLLERIKDAFVDFFSFLTDNFSYEVRQTVLDILAINMDMKPASKTSFNPLNKVNLIKPKVEEVTNKRPIIDKTKIKSELDKTSLKDELQNLMNTSSNISLTPENLVSLLEQKGVIKKDC